MASGKIQRIGGSMDLSRQIGDVTLRPCHTVEEFRQAVQLQRDVWHFADEDLVPARLFVVGDKIGGHVLGAYAGDRMVGFAYGIPGHRDSRPYMHSHMLAVAAEYRNRRLGRHLKLMQRDLVLAEGFDLIEWTFDPLEIKNAFLNIERLGVIVRRYSANHYGVSSSPLQGGLPSDRFVAEWWINSDRVEQTLREGKRPPVKVERWLEVPAEVAAWKASNSERHKALEVQTRNREAILQAFAEGLAVTAYECDANQNGRIGLGYYE